MFAFMRRFNTQRTAALILAVILILTTFVPAPAWQGDEPTSENKTVELTVYNSDLALVKETRPLTLTLGLNEIRYTDVAAMIDPTSVRFSSRTSPTDTRVLEQNFEYDLVGAEKLLEKYVDQPIEVITEDGSVYQGKLLNGSGDIILMTDDGKVSVLRREQIRTFNFPALPDGLITRPTLVWTVDTEKAGTHTTDVTYLTHGIGWRANYVLLLAGDEKTLDLNGWVTLDNRSGVAYQDARLKLVAGDIARAASMGVEKTMDYAALEAPRIAPSPQVSERGFFEYHLYEVNRPVTVRNNQTKQIEFVTSTGITATKFFVYDGSGISFGGYGPVYDQGYGSAGRTKINVMVEFMTGKENNLDAPLPAGVVRIFKPDEDGAPLLIGEDSIDHTPKGEKIELYVGDAFDIVGERTQTDFKRLGDKVVEETFKIVVRNRKESAVEVRVNEHLYRWSQWEIVQASDKGYTKLDAQTIEWRVPVKANDVAEITYTVRYSF